MTWCYNSLVMRDVYEAALSAIYGSASSASYVDVRNALCRQGFTVAPPPSDISAIADANNNIEIEIRDDGSAVYRWVGPHYGARRSLANRYAVLRRGWAGFAR